MAKVIWTDPALADLSRVFEFIAQRSQSVDTAERVCLELLSATHERLTHLPDSGALVEELRDFGAREVYQHRYRINYVHRQGACYIVQCVHSSCDLAKQLEPERWARLL